MSKYDNIPVFASTLKSEEQNGVLHHRSAKGAKNLCVLQHLKICSMKNESSHHIVQVSFPHFQDG
jgi:hypothetical protein